MEFCKRMNSIVSIIIPIYNVEKYLNICLDSVVRQTYQDIEIILIDDGSTDSSSRICDIWAEKDERVTVSHIVNGGVSNARNTGISIARGEYIAFIDSDDIVQPNYIEVLYTNMIDTQSDLSICGFDFSKEQTLKKQKKKSVINTFNRFEALGQVLLGKYFAGQVWNKLFKKDILQGILFDKSICLYEDLLFVVEYINKCEKVVYTDLPLYTYVERKSSVCHSEMNTSKLSALVAIDRIRQVIPSDLEINLKYSKTMLLLMYLTMGNCEAYIDTIKNELDTVYDRRVYKFCSIKTKIRIYLTKKHFKFYLFLNKIKFKG